LHPVILYNAHFITFKKRPPNIQAILLNNGLIEKIYFKKSLLPQNIKKINLKGNYVIPGFTDCHTHFIARGIELQRIDLEKCKSLNDCIEKLQSELYENNEILFGSNWDETGWGSFKLDKLTKHTLDKISKKKSIIMRRICGHFAVVNTRALNLIPQNRKIIDRENGYLYEDIALNLDEIFKPSNVMLEKAIKLGTTEALKNGITTVHEITDPRRFRLLQKIKKTKGLKIRCAVYITSKYFYDVLSSGISSGFGDDFLKFAGIKIFLDGSVGAKTAAMTKPYNYSRTKGKILITMRKLEDIIRKAEDNSIQLMIHSIGDRTTDTISRVFERNIDKENPLRHRLEHIEILNTSSVRKIAKMNLIVSMQPNFVRRWQNPGGMYEQYLGKRYREMNCFKKLLDSGIKVIFGSDCMPLGPLYGIQGALEHPFSCGRLSTCAAFRAYTKDGAYATFDENKKGTIDTNKLADLVVLDKNPLKEKEPDKIKILMVLIAGKIVYRRANVSH